MTWYRPAAVIFVALVSLAGCGTFGNSNEPLNFTTAAGPKSAGGEGAGYVLSEEEQAFDCKKLTGRMQIRILDIRGYEGREKTTLASRGMHTAGKMVFGGTNAGLNTDAQFTKDRAMLEAFNKQLVAKDCKSFDLNSALAGEGVPSPTIEAPSKAAAKASEAQPKKP